jgi:diguanylate cyclase (GGDEF)-like protein
MGMGLARALGVGEGMRERALEVVRFRAEETQARQRAYMRAFELVVDVQCGVPGAGPAIDALIAEAEERDWPDVVRAAMFAAIAAAAHLGAAKRRAAIARLLARAEDDGAPIMVALALAARAGLDVSEATPELAMTSDDDLARATVMLESFDGPLMEQIAAHNQCAAAYGVRWLWELCDEQYAAALKLAPDPPAPWARYVLPAIVFNRAEMQVNWACVHRQVGEHDLISQRWSTWENVMSSSAGEGMPAAWAIELQALGLLLSALAGEDVSERAHEMLLNLRGEEHRGAWPVGWLHLAVAIGDHKAGRIDGARAAVELAVSEIDRSGSADPYDLALFLAAELEAEGRPSAAMRYAQHELALRWSNRMTQHSAMLRRIQAERLRREHDVLTQQVHLDDLTTLLNRRGFSRYMESLSRQDTSAMSVLVADLDNFKLVNDRYGHQIGDMVLVSVGRILKSHVRPSDCAVRLGGDEFALALRWADPEVARQRAEALVAAVRVRPWEDLAPGLEITISVGLASGPSAELPALIDRADHALYEAKRSGRNRVVCDFAPSVATTPDRSVTGLRPDGGDAEAAAPLNGELHHGARR